MGLSGQTGGGIFHDDHFGNRNFNLLPCENRTGCFCEARAPIRSNNAIQPLPQDCDGPAQTKAYQLVGNKGIESLYKHSKIYSLNLLTSSKKVVPRLSLRRVFNQKERRDAILAKLLNSLKGVI